MRFSSNSDESIFHLFVVIDILMAVGETLFFSWNKILQIICMKSIWIKLFIRLRRNKNTHELNNLLWSSSKIIGIVQFS